MAKRSGAPKGILIPLQSITGQFVCTPDCPICKGCGHVCENHRNLPWGEMHPGGCSCGDGAPCPMIEARRNGGNLADPVAELEKVRDTLYRDQPDTFGAINALIGYLQYQACDHQWESRQVGGDPTVNESTEVVTVCKKCGAEKID